MCLLSACPGDLQRIQTISRIARTHAKHTIPRGPSVDAIVDTILRHAEMLERSWPVHQSLEISINLSTSSLLAADLFPVIDLSLHVAVGRRNITLMLSLNSLVYAQAVLVSLTIRI